MLNATDKTIIISIHALRVEGDARGNFHGLYIEIFLSTPSGWRATDVAIDDRHCARISIHALRVEGDLFVKILWLIDDLFLSTPSGWRATAVITA